MTIILFILIFSIVVLSHEFGHFLLARKNGVHVVEFSIGMGPMIWHHDSKGTRYAVRALPFGGACMFEGEDELDLPERRDSVQDESAPYGRKFTEVGVWGRISIIFAGPLFNLLLGYVIAVILVGFSGSDLPVVSQIMEDSAAEAAGMQSGDVLTKVNGESIHLYREVSLISALNTNGNPLDIVYERDGETYEVTLQPIYDEEAGRYYMGIVGGGTYLDCKGLQVLQYGFYETQYVMKATLKSLQMLFTGRLQRTDVSGPVGIAHYVGETYDEVKGYGIPTVVLTMLNIVLLLSVNLGIMNLLPLPALDGGRLIFLFVELIRGKPVAPDKEGFVHFIGFVFFFALMLIVMYNDIVNYWIH
ncbi:MAG: RIP metalloprotease RseP [Lachnospiraceae bacterium]|nr:RIP metalloprotease RseP [Lachnospiraceae bacterium]